MRTPWLWWALALLVLSNAFVLAHVALNRTGEPDSELELTARELNYFGNRSDDSSVVLMLRWQNTAQEYPPGLPPDGPGWFDQKKLEGLGYDLRVPADSPQAERFSENLRSRKVFVALELDGPAWEAWLKDREPRLETETSYSPQVTLQDRLDIERQTTPRLVSIDVARDPAELRGKYPDRKRVMILEALVRAKVVPERKASATLTARPAFWRGAITRLAIETINVPEPFSRFFDAQPSYTPWTYDGKQVKLTPPPYSATLRVGSKYEPWVAGVKQLR